MTKFIYFATGNHALASARVHETHEFLRDCFAPVWKEVEELMANLVVSVEGTDYTLSFVCGSDCKVLYTTHTFIHMYKKYICVYSCTLHFLLLMMGLNNSTSTYACLWCTVTKDERFIHDNAEYHFRFVLYGLDGICPSQRRCSLQLLPWQGQDIWITC